MAELTYMKRDQQTGRCLNCRHYGVYHNYLVHASHCFMIKCACREFLPEYVFLLKVNRNG